MSSAWGASFGSAWGDAWGNLGVVIQPPSPDFIPGGRTLPGKKTRLRHAARAGVRLDLLCAVRSAARLEVSAIAAVDAESGLNSTGSLQLPAVAKVAAPPAIDAQADAVDVVLEMLLLSS